MPLFLAVIRRDQAPCIMLVRAVQHELFKETRISTSTNAGANRAITGMRSRSAASARTTAVGEAELIPAHNPDLMIMFSRTRFPGHRFGDSRVSPLSCVNARSGMGFEPRGQTGTIARVADWLGVRRETLRTWVRQAEVDAGKRLGTTTSDAQRLADLELRTVNCGGRTRSHRGRA